jgi:hypothetical protein
MHVEIYASQLLIAVEDVEGAYRRVPNDRVGNRLEGYVKQPGSDVENSRLHAIVRKIRTR